MVKSIGSQRCLRAVVVVAAFLLCFYSLRPYRRVVYNQNNQNNQPTPAQFSPLVNQLNQRITVPLSYNHVQNFSGTQYRSSHVKRAALTFRDAVCKGSKLLEQIYASSPNASPFTFDDLEDNGWSLYPDDDPRFELDSPDVFEAMQERGISIEDEDNPRVDARLDRPFRNSAGAEITPPTEEVRPKLEVDDSEVGSGGFYYQRYNVRSGTIIAEFNYGPRYLAIENDPTLTGQALQEAIPHMNKWSDVTWAVWSHYAGGSASTLRYIFRVNVVTEDTKAIINLANDLEPGPELDLPWPGRTFDMSSDEGKALLGTPHGVGIAYLIISGLSVLGRRVPLVTTFSDIDNNYFMIFDLGS
ncbi:MAG: hypothetical protein Q9167_004295 [Letrouitia subvulpina]